MGFHLSTLPAGCCHTTVQSASCDTLNATGGCPDLDDMEIPTIHATIRDLIDSWGEEAWPLRDSEFGDSEQIAIAIQNRTAHGVSDGSYMPK